MSKQIKNIGGQAFFGGILMRGKRCAAAYRDADGAVRVKTWPSAKSDLGKIGRIPLVRGICQMGSAAVEGARTAVKTAGLTIVSEKGGLSLHKLRMYHGGEHKAIACYEKGLEMTADNVRDQSRIHPRCGTVLAVTAVTAASAMTALLPKRLDPGKRDLAELLALALALGLSYEVNRLAWKKGNPVAKAVTAPGRWAQKLTTAEPDDRAIECAIAALKAAEE